jgi:dihydrolipoamide dehydrogenase
MGSVWRRLGAEVTMLEALPSLLPVVDVTIAKEAQKLFARQGLAIQTGIKITDVKVGANDVTVAYDDASGKAVTATYDHLIVSIGRVPFTGGLGAEGVGLAVDERGFVKVDDDCKTNLANVWAIGDVVRGPMLAHKAEEEGVSVAERIAGQKPHVDFDTIPWVIYTSPEIAWVGRTEQQVKEAGIDYRDRKLPVRRQRTRARHGRHARAGQDRRGPQDRPHPRGAHDRPMVSELIPKG